MFALDPKPRSCSSTNIAPPRVDATRVPGTRLQRKATVNAPNDPFEREADTVADAVLRMSPSGGIGQSPVSVQRKCTACAEKDEKVHRMRAPATSGEAMLDGDAAVRAAAHGGEHLPAAARAFFEPRFGYDFSRVRVHTGGAGIGQSPVSVQRKCTACAEKDEKVHRMRAPATSGEAMLDGDAAVRAAAHGGEHLPAAARAFFEPRFGYDFSRVRVHTGGAAATASRAINAEAYTVGRDIVFGAGAFNFNAERGRRLLAHELTHVVQQGGAAQAAGSHAASPTVARTISKQMPTVQRRLVVNPADTIPMPAGTSGPPQALTNVVQGLLNSTCPTGGFAVDGTTGAVSARSRFCEWHPPLLPGRTEADLSATPAGCKCLCDAVTNTQTTTIAFNAGGPGTSPGSVPGAGPGQGGNRTDARVNIDPRLRLRWLIGGRWVDRPFYLVLAHELCGHALPKMQGTHAARGPTPPGGTPPQELHSVDIESDIAAEGGLGRRPTDYSGGVQLTP